MPVRSLRSTDLVVVDDRPLFAQGIAAALTDHGGRVSVVENIDVASEPIGPGMVIASLRTLDPSQVEALTRRGRSVLVYGRASSSRLHMAIAAGAVGFLEETVRVDDLRAAVSAVRAGGGTGFPVLDPHDSGFGLLTRREEQVLAALIEGLRPADIAERDFVSVTTVRNQVQAILTKLNVHSQLEAVAAAHRGGWSASAA